MNSGAVLGVIAVLTIRLLLPNDVAPTALLAIAALVGFAGPSWLTRTVRQVVSGSLQSPHEPS